MRRPQRLKRETINMPAHRRIIHGVATAVLLGAAVAALSTTTWATPRELAMHANGHFDVTLTPQQADNPPARGAGLARLSIDKRYHGSIDGTAQGEMLAIGDGKQHGAYVAIEKVTATLDGRRGSFALVHRAALSQGSPEHWEILVVPESGTEQLAGIRGTLTITIRDGKHFYELRYTLPEK
jgi:hypothetical protein